MLENEADPGNSDPAAKAKDNRFSTCFYQFYNVGIQPDSRHCNDNEEFTQFFDRGEKFAGYTKNICRYCCDDGSNDKINNEERENLFQADRVSRRRFFLFCAVKRKY